MQILVGMAERHLTDRVEQILCKLEVSETLLDLLG